jgi:hypothetical protein
MTNFGAHWDYNNHCPKKIHKIMTSKDFTVSGNSLITSPPKKDKSSGIFGLLKCCFKKGPSKNSKKQDYYVDFTSDNHTSKGYFLDTLWRKGIPDRFRTKIWPFAI